jgi:glycosyltransferase involved in cell wall biosynthesis
MPTVDELERTARKALPPGPRRGMKVLVLTTSYPRDGADVAGHFVRDSVEAARAAGVEVEVVSPASFRHFGIAYGHGIAGNLRRRPWLALLLPAFLLSFARAARRVARGADLVHAHWLPSALVALATRRPYVVQLWGTDVQLARKAPWLFRPLLRRALAAVAASEFLAQAARELGARAVTVVPPVVRIPEHVRAAAEPPHVLYVGRLSAEKGILEFLAATDGLPRVIVGDGPLRDRVPEAVGFVAPGEVGGYYERAAVVCVPSRREGFGLAAREAMAYGRPVVATAVGGLVDVSGVLVPPGDVVALREAIERLLADAELRARVGAAAREAIRAHRGGEALVALYQQNVPDG